MKHVDPKLKCTLLGAFNAVLLPLLYLGPILQIVAHHALLMASLLGNTCKLEMFSIFSRCNIDDHLTFFHT